MSTTDTQANEDNATLHTLDQMKRFCLDKFNQAVKNDHLTAPIPDYVFQTVQGYTQATLAIETIKARMEKSAVAP